MYLRLTIGLCGDPRRSRKFRVLETADRRIRRQRPAALPIQFTSHFDGGQQRFHAPFGTKRQFEKGGQIAAQSL